MKAVYIRRPRLLILLALILGVIGFWQEARAQMGMGMGDPTQFAATIGKRSLEDYARILSLDAEQKDALKGLYEGYTSAHKDLMDEMKKAMEAVQEKFQETQDMKVWQKEFPKQMQEIGGRAEKLEKGFFDDFKSLLNAKQQVSWDVVERHRRREKGLRFGFISGQTVDMTKVISALKIDPKAVPGLADQLDQYELAMDRAIQSFEKFQKDQEKAQQDFDFDMSKMQEMMAKVKDMMKDMLAISKGMRDVNRQYARTIEPLLPEAQRPKFEAELNRRVHPRIFKESYVTQAIKTAEGFSDISADQKKTLSEIKESYAQELAAANKKWATTTEEREEKTGGQMMEMMSMWGGGGGDETVKEAANKARADRKELDKQTKEKVLALLSEEQKKRLPEEKKEPQGMFGMGDLAPPDEEGSN